MRVLRYTRVCFPCAAIIIESRLNVQGPKNKPLWGKVPQVPPQVSRLVVLLCQLHPITKLNLQRRTEREGAVRSRSRKPPCSTMLYVECSRGGNTGSAPFSNLPHQRNFQLILSRLTALTRSRTNFISKFIPSNFRKEAVPKLSPSSSRFLGYFFPAIDRALIPT